MGRIGAMGKRKRSLSEPYCQSPNQTEFRATLAKVIDAIAKSPHFCGVSSQGCPQQWSVFEGEWEAG